MVRFPYACDSLRLSRSVDAAPCGADGDTARNGFGAAGVGNGRMTPPWRLAETGGGATGTLLVIGDAGDRMVAGRATGCGTGARRGIGGAWRRAAGMEGAGALGTDGGMGRSTSGGRGVGRGTSSGIPSRLITTGGAGRLEAGARGPESVASMRAWAAFSLAAASARLAIMRRIMLTPKMMRMMIQL